MNQPNSGEDYAGVDLLESLECARNYNNSLVRRVRRFFKGERELMDFGAGTGTFSKLLGQKGFHVRCVEPDKKLGERLVASGFDVISSLDAEPDASISALYSLNVLEHIRNDEEIIRLIFAKLKPGGRMLIYVPALMFLWTSLDDKVCHFRRYNRKGILKKLQQAGFVGIKTRYADSMGVFATLLYRFFLAKDGTLPDRKSIRRYDTIVYPFSILGDIPCRFFMGKNLWAEAQKPKG